MATKSASLQKKLDTLKKGLTNKFISTTQKDKIKSQIEKIEKEMKASKPAKTTKSSGARASISKLDKLINKKKFGVYKGAGVDLKKDGERPAKPIGKRKSASGNTYYEYRANRIDVKQPSKKATYPKLAKGGSINMDRHIWEGWTVGNFIEELNIEFRYHPKFKSRDEVKKWAMENQPYYKKYIPEVVDYYWEKNQEKYEKGGYMAKGGGVLSKYEIVFEKDGNKEYHTTEAYNKADAMKTAKYLTNQDNQFKGYKPILIKEMAKGGMLMHGFQNGDKVIEIYKGQGIVDNGGVIVVVNPDKGTRFIIDLDESKPTGKKSMNMSMDDQIKSAKEYIDWVSSDGETPDTLVSVIDKYGSYEDGGYMAKGGEHTNSLQKYLKVASERAFEGGGNGANITDYGLSEVAMYIDQDIYSSETRNLFKKLVDSMVNDEIKNNQVGASDYKKGGYMAEGGVTEKEVVESNAQMVLSQIKAVKHHADELSRVVSSKSDIEAWVVGKIERASTDLSDITHYLDGQKDKMSMGGSIRYYTHKMDKK